MKKNFLTLIAVLFFAITFSQSVPQGINYQATARDATGAVLMNETLTIQFSVISDISTGNISWQETHTITTTDYGLFTAIIGQGTTTGSGSSATFDEVDWGLSNHLLKVEANDGSGFVDMGTSAFMSVPYALYSNDGSTITDTDADTKIQVEETADQDIIRFDLAGTETWAMKGARLEALNTGYSIFIGNGAGALDDLSSNRNVFIGESAGANNTTGSGNTAYGAYTLLSNTTGYNNAANGKTSLYSNTDGYNNTANGTASLYNNTNGYGNTANGTSTLSSNTTGANNAANGTQSMVLNTTGSSNTANGYRALFSNTTGSSNVALGLESGYLSTGNGNIFLGFNSGYNETGSNKLYIDNSNTTSPLIYGEFDNDLLTINGTLNVTGSVTAVSHLLASDRRFKKDIITVDNALDKVLQLRGVYYYWRQKDFPNKKFDDKQELGLIAQEVESIIPEIVGESEDGYKAVEYQKLVALLIEAIKDQQAIIDGQKTEISDMKVELDGRLKALEKMFNTATLNK